MSRKLIAVFAVIIIVITAIFTLITNHALSASLTANTQTKAVQGASTNDLASPEEATPGISRVDLGDITIVTSSTQTQSAVGVPGDWDDEGSAQRPLSADQVAAVTTYPYLGALPVKVSVPGLGDFMVAKSQGPTSTVIYGASLKPAQAKLRALTIQETLVGCGIAVLAIAICSLVTRRALRPLEDVTRIAEAVSQAPLAQGAVDLPNRVAAPDSSSGAESDRVAVAFNRMLENIESSFQERERTEQAMRRFVSEASHELRNPVASIHGYAEHLLSLSTTDPTTQKSLTRIRDESTRLGSLVDTLLLLARLDAGRHLTPTDVDLTQIVLEVVDDARAAHPNHHWILHLPDEPVTVVGVEDSLRRILINLCANAGTHTPDGTTVTVAIKDDHCQLELSVTDDGPGIPHHEQEKIFDRFTQATSGANLRSAANAGLGLAIAKGLANESGYDLTLESRAGHTEFSVTMNETTA